MSARGSASDAIKKSRSDASGRRTAVYATSWPASRGHGKLRDAQRPSRPLSLSPLAKFSFIDPCPLPGAPEDTFGHRAAPSASAATLGDYNAQRFIACGNCLRRVDVDCLRRECSDLPWADVRHVGVVVTAQDASRSRPADMALSAVSVTAPASAAAEELRGGKLEPQAHLRPTAPPSRRNRS